LISNQCAHGNGRPIRWTDFDEVAPSQHHSATHPMETGMGPVRVTHLSGSCSPKTIQINAQRQHIGGPGQSQSPCVCVCVWVLACNLYKLLLSSLSLKSHFAHISSQSGSSSSSSPPPIRSVLLRSALYTPTAPFVLRPASCQAYKLLYDIVLNLRDK